MSSTNKKCKVSVQFEDCDINGFISYESAVKITHEIIEPLFENRSPAQVVENEQEHRIQDDRSTQRNWSGSHKNDTIPITDGQLSCLERNSAKEQLEICERYHVQGLDQLTKLQASEAIKASMDAKEARKRKN